ncbi:sporulation initiation factor Spo0A [[Eubacterium] hominis]|uniref:sporulation initiation factor Spo0A n=1 Tax=[Eubacterium] hominis TaxID=2764325 RepID=UPI003A4DA16C
MKTEIMKEIVKMIATDENQKEEDIYREMQIAIDQAYFNDDPMIKKRWERIPHEGVKPTPEDVVDYLVTLLK